MAEDSKDKKDKNKYLIIYLETDGDESKRFYASYSIKDDPAVPGVSMSLNNQTGKLSLSISCYSPEAKGCEGEVVISKPKASDDVTELMKEKMKATTTNKFNPKNLREFFDFLFHLHIGSEYVTKKSESGRVAAVYFCYYAKDAGKESNSGLGKDAVAKSESKDAAPKIKAAGEDNISGVIKSFDIYASSWGMYSDNQIPNNLRVEFNVEGQQDPVEVAKAEETKEESGETEDKDASLIVDPKVKSISPKDAVEEKSKSDKLADLAKEQEDLENKADEFDKKADAEEAKAKESKANADASARAKESAIKEKNEGNKKLFENREEKYRKAEIEHQKKADDYRKQAEAKRAEAKKVEEKFIKTSTIESKTTAKPVDKPKTKKQKK